MNPILSERHRHKSTYCTISFIKSSKISNLKSKTNLCLRIARILVTVDMRTVTENMT